jgi:glyoxylase-like metal-dependent hydrolase (beta-lactamase superfamily II)
MSPHFKLDRRGFLAASYAALGAGLIAASTTTSAHHLPFEQNAPEPSLDNRKIQTFRLASCNSYLLRQGKTAVLIDTGAAESAEQLDALMQESGFDPRQLSAILVTHANRSHAGGARYFRARYGTPILGSARDLYACGRDYGDSFCPTDLLAQSRAAEGRTFPYDTLVPDLLITERTELDKALGLDTEISVLPGHAEGSLLIAAGEVAFVGDLFFQESLYDATAKTALAPHQQPPRGGGARQDIERLVSDLAPRAQQFLPGHFDPLSRDQVYAVLEQRLV